MKLFLKILVPVCAIFAGLSASAGIVYDNSTTSLNKDYGPGVEFGDEIILAAPGVTGDVTITNLTFEYTALNLSGNESVTLRLYKNDGTQATVGGNRPNTLLYTDSAHIINATNGATLSFTLPSIAVPQDFTWSVEFTGLTTGEFAGLDLYGPPRVGNNYTDFWEKDANGVWQLKKVPGTEMDFGARVEGNANSTVNDAPVLDFPLQMVSVNENTAVAIQGIVVSDADVGFGIMTATLTVTNGTLTLAGTNGLLFTSGGNGSNSMVFRGTITDINTALQPLTYLGNTNFFGMDTVTITVNDNGNTGSGGALSATGTIPITVGFVNHLPVISPIADQNLPDGTASAEAVFEVSDIETPPPGITVTASSSNQALIRNSDLGLSGKGQTRTLTMLLQPGVLQTSTISVVATDTDGGRTTNTFKVTVSAAPPVILAESDSRIDVVASVSPAPPTVVTFFVIAAGTKPLGYQWYFNPTSPAPLGSPLNGQTSSNLVLTNVVAANAGFYSVVVTNSLGGVTNSPPFQLIVDTAAAIVTPPLPASTNIAEGGSVTYKVVASGTPPISYAWYFSPVGSATAIPLHGQFTDTLVLTNLANDDSGDYFATVLNFASLTPATSAKAHLNVILNPVINKQPLSATNFVGTVATFSVSASGTNLAYQWFKVGTPNNTPLVDDGTHIVGATSNLLTILNVQTTDAAGYIVVVTNILGVAATSQVATLTVALPASILRQPPARIDLAVGGSTNFSVGATGSGLTYQWFIDDQAIAVNGTGASLTIVNAKLTNTGNYYVKVSNGGAVVQSSNTVLKVWSKPVITTKELKGTKIVSPNAPFTIATDVSGTDPTLQWFLSINSGTPVALTNGTGGFSGVNSPILTNSAATTNATGTYTLVASNFAAVVTSSGFDVFVGLPPVIQVQPTNRVAAVGGSTTFTVSANGTPPFQYQWRKGTTILSLQSTPDFTISNISKSDAGAYSVNVINGAGAALSADASLQVLTPLTVFKQPVGNSALPAGQSFAMFVTVSGDGPLTFQWFKGTVPITANVLTLGSSSFVSLPNVTTAASGDYTVKVSNPVSSVTAGPATVTVLGPPVLSGLPSTVILNTGGSTNLTVTSTSAGGPFTFEWRRNGLSIPGTRSTGTSSTYSFTNAKATDGGTYTVTGQGAGGASESAPITVLVVTNNPTSPFQLFQLVDNLEACLILTNLPSGTFNGNTFGFGTQTGEKAVIPTAAASGWITWVAPVNGAVTFSTLGSDFDTILSAYSGGLTFPSLVKKAFDIDGAGFHNSQIQFQATQGTAYRIDVDGVNGAQGNVVLSWNIIPGNVPEISSQPSSVTAPLGAVATFTVGASLSGGGTIQYQWFHDGQAVSNGTSPAPDGLLRTVSGATSATLSIVDIVPGDAGVYTATLTASTAPNLSVSTDPATLIISSGFGITPGFAPFDLKAGGIHLLSSPSNTYSAILFMNNTGAGKKIGEPNHCGQTGGNSVWTKYVAPTNGILRATTDGSAIDTVLAAYTQPGTTAASLVPVACDDNSGTNGLTSAMNFAVTQGTAYYLAVDGVGGAQGAIQLNLDLAVAPTITSQPVASQSVRSGGNASFAVTAVNTLANPPLTYQWQLNGANIPGATSSTLALSGVTASSAGTYTVLVSNFAGTTTSSASVLSVVDPVSIVNLPKSLTVPAGGTATFSVDAVGSFPISYQWSLNGTALAGQTNSSITIANAQAANAGTYKVVVTNAVSSASAQATLTLDIPLTITTQPASQTVVKGTNVTFSVVAAGLPPIGYQWRFEGVAIAGATGASFTLTNVNALQNGNYSVIVTNATKSVLSAPATLVVVLPVSILQQPRSQVVALGGVAVLDVGVAGTQPINYQWRLNGTAIAGATSGSLTVSNIQSGNLGAYSVLVSNAYGSVLSADATLALNPVPVITLQPIGQTVLAGSKVTLTVSATGLGTLAYSWRLNNQTVPGATNSTLVLTNVNETTAGTYQAVVNSEFGTAVSSNAVVVVNFPVSITQAPVSQAAKPGDTVRFDVSVAGTAPFTYQWQFNGTNLAGQTNSALLLANISTTNSGQYRVIVSNAFGSVTSSAASLTVATTDIVQFTSIKYLANKTVQLSVLGPNGKVFTLQTSTNLQSWATIVTNVTFTNQSFSFTDTKSTNLVRRFYRIAPAGL